MAVRVPAALPEDPNSVLNTHIGLLTDACYSSSNVSWAPRAPSLLWHTQKSLKKSFQLELIWLVSFFFFYIYSFCFCILRISCQFQNKIQVSSWFFLATYLIFLVLGFLIGFVLFCFSLGFQEDRVLEFTLWIRLPSNLNLLASASRVLGLKARATTPVNHFGFYIKIHCTF